MVKSAPQSTVGRLLRRARELNPHGEALSVGDRRLTYDALFTESGALAAALLDAGVRPLDRVCLFAPNLIESYVALFATLRIGAVFVPLNPRLTARELRGAVERSAPRVLLIVPEWGGHDYQQRVTAATLGLVHDTPLTVITLRGDVEGAIRYLDLVASGAAVAKQARLESIELEVNPDQPALLQFTSGTTSQPKAALLSHRATARMAFELGERFGLTTDDRYFGCSPICHLGGMTFSLLAVVSHGASFVTLPVFEAGLALATIADERCSVVHGIDTHFTLLTGHESFDPAQLPLRLVSVSALPERVAQVAEMFGPGIITISQYGSTETGGAPTCAAFDDPLDRRMGTVGRPLPGLEIAIVDPDTGTLRPTGQIGEIRVGGWSLMLGYLDDPEATAAILDDDQRLCTGDLGFLDGDGYLHYAGRLKNMLRVGGENVSVEEVETVIKSDPQVRECVVVGVPDDRLGEVGYAYVVGHDNVVLGTESLVDLCGQQLARFKLPRHIELIAMAEMPLTASGKIDRKELSSRAQSRTAGAS